MVIHTHKLAGSLFLLVRNFPSRWLLSRSTPPLPAFLLLRPGCPCVPLLPRQACCPCCAQYHHPEALPLPCCTQLFLKPAQKQAYYAQCRKCSLHQGEVMRHGRRSALVLHSWIVSPGLTPGGGRGRGAFGGWGGGGDSQGEGMLGGHRFYLCLLCQEFDLTILRPAAAFYLQGSLWVCASTAASAFLWGDSPLPRRTRVGTGGPPRRSSRSRGGGASGGGPARWWRR